MTVSLQNTWASGEHWLVPGSGFMIQGEGVHGTVVQGMHQMCSQEGRKCQEMEGCSRKSVTREPFAHIVIDISGPYNVSNSGNEYLLLVSDYITK